jgi:hypothetical protein
VVTLGIGRWYLDGPLLLPDNVVLKGAGMDRTAIYVAFRSASNTPGTMIGAVHGSRPGDMMYPRVRYGVEDLAVYVVSHFNSIIDISPFTDGVRVQRIRIRANMCAPHGIAAAAPFRKMSKPSSFSLGHVAHRFFGADWWGSASHPAGADGGRG